MALIESWGHQLCRRAETVLRMALAALNPEVVTHASRATPPRPLRLLKTNGANSQEINRNSNPGSKTKALIGEGQLQP